METLMGILELIDRVMRIIAALWVLFSVAEIKDNVRWIRRELEEMRKTRR